MQVNLGAGAPRSSHRSTPQRPEAAAVPFDGFQAAIMLMTLVSVWRIQDLFPALGAIKIQFLAPALAALTFLLDHDPRRRLNSIVNPLTKTLLAILALIVLSIPTSLWPGKSLDFLIDDHGKTVLLFCLMAVSVRSIVDLQRYALLHVGGAVLYSYFVITTFRVGKSGRLGDLIYYDSNDLGLLIVCAIPLCVYFLRPGVNLILRVLITAAVGLLVYTLVQTGSRGAFLALIACGAYLLFNFSAISKSIRGYAVGAIVVFMMVFGGDRYWEMMRSLLSPTQDYNWSHDTGRKAIWKRGMGYMFTHPLTGVGARAFQQAEGTISNISVRQQYGIGLKWSTAHNSFVQIGAELGIFGLGLFVASLAQAWRFVRDSGRQARGQEARAGPMLSFGHALGGVLVAFAVAGFFLSAAYSSFLYTVFALVVGMMRLSAGQPTPARRGALSSGGAPLVRGPASNIGHGLRRPVGEPRRPLPAGR